MARLLTMGKLTCFSLFNKKSKAKSELPVYAESPENVHMDGIVVDFSSKSCVDAKKDSCDIEGANETSQTTTNLDDHESDFKDGLEQPDLANKATTVAPVLDQKQRNRSSSDDDFSFAPQLDKSGYESPGIAYEGGDEEEAKPFSDHYAPSGNKNSIFKSDSYNSINENVHSGMTGSFGNISENVVEFDGKYDEGSHSAILSDSGIYQNEELRSGSASPVLRKTVSTSKLMEMSATGERNNEATKGRSSKELPPSNSQSYEDLQALEAGQKGFQGSRSSRYSERTTLSADKVILKRGSSSNVLPSGARKFWWKIFLWSHRNLHKGGADVENINSQAMQDLQDVVNTKGGYSSDTLDVYRSHPTERHEQQEISKAIGKQNSPSASEIVENGAETSTQRDVPLSLQAPVPQSSNQWMAFTAEQSSLWRVQEWINKIDTTVVCQEDMLKESQELQEEQEDMKTNMSDIGCSESVHRMEANIPEGNLPLEVQIANNAIRSLNLLSSVAHISGMGLKVIPVLAPYTSLREINLSGNNIARISAGHLPRSLHVLDLSRNKISAIEGLRELTRLRVLNLSYNKISRIGRGLANCTLIRQLYLAGNKISDVEGLHRLLKLTVLDLSFNKITTVKALGQLAANYSSLLALNLLGNPVHTNVGEEQLRKSLVTYLPQLSYLNRQPIKSVSAREAVVDSVARAALGDSGGYARNKNSRRGNHATSSSHRSVASYSRGSRANEASIRSRGHVNKHGQDKGKAKLEAGHHGRSAVA